ncbi:MAG: glycosyltransferase family 9 protein [Candidatus Omnitrophota bacterium]|nr:glycosyltransferase family 9 protein [Candidatus Omnitrophota bacterium]
MNDVKQILVITLSNIGDVVLTLPVIGALKENFREALIDVVVGTRAKEVLEADPRIDRMYVYDKSLSFIGKFKFLLGLRKKRYDLIVDLRNSLLSFLLRPRFSSKPTLNLPEGVIHKIDAHMLRVKSLGLSATPNSYQIWISQIDADNASKLLKKKGISDSDEAVCISPGAKSHIKRWPEGNFAKVCDKLIDEMKVKVVFVGDASDRAICERILNRMRSYAVSVAGETNLRELAWCIKRSRLLITNDSAPLHIAGSVGTPSVAIFGPTDYRKYGPREGLGVALRKGLHCSPCEVAQCRYNLECMKAVEAGEVFEAAREILSERKEPRT